MMKKYMIQSAAFIIALSMALGALYYYLPTTVEQTVPSDKSISDYNEMRDKAEILKIFETDRHWLLSSEDYSPEHMLKNKAPNKRETRYYGALTIKVLREDNQFIGFVAYYPKNFFIGQILFVAVKPEYRGKGYANRLLTYAVNDLKKQGSTMITLVTRTTNKSAQAAYKKFGFQPRQEEDGFVYFELRV